MYELVKYGIVAAGVAVPLATACIAIAHRARSKAMIVDSQTYVAKREADAGLYERQRVADANLHEKKVKLVREMAESQGYKDWVAARKAMAEKLIGSDSDVPSLTGHDNLEEALDGTVGTNPLDKLDDLDSKD